MGRLKPECVDEYVKLHADVWPAVLARNSDCNLQNYSIFFHRLPTGENYLFSCVEYVGEDLEADMRRLAADPEIQRWWDVCKPCFERIEDLPPGEVWVPMEQVFFQA
jgi:L-rhamnose mutarotase